LSLASHLAALLERSTGSPCGECGLPHATTGADYDAKPDGYCCCPCCYFAFFERFVIDFPDLIERRGKHRVITDAAVREATRRVNLKIDEIERGLPPR